MKRQLCILGLLACVVVGGPAVCLAQDVEGVDEMRPGKLKKIDADGDGQVSLDEFLAKAESRFGKMDADADGYLTVEEFKEGRKAVRAKGRERRQQRQTEKGAE